MVWLTNSEVTRLALAKRRAREEADRREREADCRRREREFQATLKVIKAAVADRPEPARTEQTVAEQIAERSRVLVGAGPSSSVRRRAAASEALFAGS